MTNRATLWRPIKVRFVKPIIQSEYIHPSLCQFSQNVTMDLGHNITFLLLLDLCEGILQRKSILFAGLLNFLNKPRF